MEPRELSRVSPAAAATAAAAASVTVAAAAVSGSGGAAAAATAPAAAAEGEGGDRRSVTPPRVWTLSASRIRTLGGAAAASRGGCLPSSPSSSSTAAGVVQAPAAAAPVGLLLERRLAPPAPGHEPARAQQMASAGAPGSGAGATAATAAAYESALAGDPPRRAVLRPRSVQPEEERSQRLLRLTARCGPQRKVSAPSVASWRSAWPSGGGSAREAGGSHSHPPPRDSRAQDRTLHSSSNSASSSSVVTRSFDFATSSREKLQNWRDMEHNEELGVRIDAALASLRQVEALQAMERAPRAGRMELAAAAAREARGGPPSHVSVASSSNGARKEVVAAELGGCFGGHGGGTASSTASFAPSSAETAPAGLSPVVDNHRTRISSAELQNLLRGTVHESFGAWLAGRQEWCAYDPVTGMLDMEALRSALDEFCATTAATTPAAADAELVQDGDGRRGSSRAAGALPPEAVFDGMHLTPVNERPFEAIASIARHAHCELLKRVTPR